MNLIQIYRITLNFINQLWSICILQNEGDFTLCWKDLQKMASWKTHRRVLNTEIVQ